jgi:hypothetical protein
MAIVFVEDTEALPWCLCTEAKKLPLGWTLDVESNVYVCSECWKPSRDNWERLDCE